MIAEPTASDIVARATRAYVQASECDGCVGGERWYWRKRAWILKHKAADWNDAQAFAIYAVLSTNSTVPENDALYLDAVQGFYIRHFGDVQRRVALAKRGDVAGALTYKKGRKIINFAENLQFPWRLHAVTIDRHAGDIVTLSRTITKRMTSRNPSTGYDVIAAGYREAAQALGLASNALQARTWVHHVECIGKAA